MLICYRSTDITKEERAILALIRIAKLHNLELLIVQGIEQVPAPARTRLLVDGSHLTITAVHCIEQAINNATVPLEPVALLRFAA